MTMSNAGMEPRPPAAPPPPRTPAELARVARREARFGARFLRVRGRRLLLVFAGLWLPLWGFRALAAGLRGAGGVPFDLPLLRAWQAVGARGLGRASRP